MPEHGFLLLARDGKVIWANPGVTDLLGFSQDELRGAVLPPLAQGAVASSNGLGAAWRSILAGDSTEAEGEVRMAAKSEERLALHWKLWAVLSDCGETRGMLSLSDTAPPS